MSGLVAVESGRWLKIIKPGSCISILRRGQGQRQGRMLIHQLFMYSSTNMNRLGKTVKKWTFRPWFWRSCRPWFSGTPPPPLPFRPHVWPLFIGPCHSINSALVLLLLKFDRLLCCYPTSKTLRAKGEKPLCTPLTSGINHRQSNADLSQKLIQTASKIFLSFSDNLRIDAYY